MATGKKYFWIKLKTDFMTSDKVDYLMSQTNGAEYVVLYQMLCMKCINTDGLLARQIGEVIIPFDAEKIARDCKYFSIDTVKQAFQLFIQLGMIYQESNGYLRIADFENMVGSETDWAAQKRKQVKSKENISIECGNDVENSVENLHTDIDIRDRDRDRDINLNNICPEKTTKKRFIKPTVEEITEYCHSRNNSVNPQKFYDYYEAKGWLVGKSPMKNWQAAIRTWEGNTYSNTGNIKKPKGLEDKICLGEM